MWHGGPIGEPLGSNLEVVSSVRHTATVYMGDSDVISSFLSMPAVLAAMIDR